MIICKESRRLGFIESRDITRISETEAKDYLRLIKLFKIEGCKYTLEFINKEFKHLFRDKKEIKTYTLDEVKKLLSQDKVFILIKHLKGDFRKWYWTDDLCKIMIGEHDFNKTTQVTMYQAGVRTLGNMGIETFFKQLNQGHWLLKL